MTDRHVVSFAVEVVRPERSDAYARIMPMVDGMIRADWVSGDHGPVVPSHFRLGDLRDYFLGRGSWPIAGDGRPALLWCTCGEAACDPLTVKITEVVDHVVWSEMGPITRPLTFDADQYQEALLAMIRELQDSGTLPDYAPHESKA